MLLEVFGAVGAITFLFFFFAEQKKPVLGIFGSFMLMVLSFWLLSDGLQIRSGEIETIATQQNGTSSPSGFTSGTSVLNGNSTTYTETTSQNISSLSDIAGTHSRIYAYTSIPVTPYAATDWFVGIMLLLTSVYALFHYIATAIAK